MSKDNSNYVRSAVYDIERTKKSDDYVFAETQSQIRSLVESVSDDKPIYRQNLMEAVALIESALPRYPLFKGKSKQAFKRPFDIGKMSDQYKQLPEIDFLVTTLADVRLTLHALEDHAQLPIFQSWEMQSDPISSGTVTQQENLRDILGQPETSVSKYSTNSLIREDRLSNSEFLSRPVKIYDNTTNDISLVEVKVWDLVTLDPTIRSRLRNWAYFKSDLEIRIVVTGTPFDIGRLYVGYHPYPSKNICLQRYITTVLPTGSGAYAPFLNYLSQSMFFRAIDVSENKPYVFTVPFICHKLKCRLVNNTSAVSDVTSFSDIAALGSLFITTKEPITSSSPTANDVGIKIYARLVNTHVSVPTATQVAVAQSQEVEAGPIESVATSIKSFSENVLEKVPTLEAAGKIVTSVSNAVSGVAAYYGWSYPILDQHNMSVRNQPFSNGSQTIGTSTAKKISLDPKQAVTADTSFTGINEDELVIDYIARIPSLFRSITWNTTDAADTILAKMMVTPHTATEYTLVDTMYQPTSCAYAVQPFSIHRSDMVYTFDVVCSKYQRGKIRIRYDPSSFQIVLLESDKSYVKEYIQVIDIQETTRFSICVPYLKERAWLQAPTLPYYSTQSDSSADIANAYAYINGFLLIEVVNPLVGPNVEPVRIDVYAHAKNLRVQQPDQSRLPTRFADFQSQDVVSETFQGEAISCSNFIFADDATSDVASTLHFGEEIVSFRSLLKRFHPTCQVAGSADVVTGPRVITTTIQTMPAANYLFSTSTPNFTNLSDNLFGYLRWAFLGYRGSIRKRLFHFVDAQSHELLKTVIKNRFNSQPANPSTGTGNIPGISSLTGSVTFIQHTNGGIEFEIPFYSQNIFQIAFSTNGIGTTFAEDMRSTWSSGYDVSSEYVGPISSYYVTEDSVAGEDFNFLCYVGSPFFVSF